MCTSNSGRLYYNRVAIILSLTFLILLAVVCLHISLCVTLSSDLLQDIVTRQEKACLY